MMYKAEEGGPPLPHVAREPRCLSPISFLLRHRLETLSPQHPALTYRWPRPTGRGRCLELDL